MLRSPLLVIFFLAVKVQCAGDSQELLLERTLAAFEDVIERPIEMIDLMGHSGLRDLPPDVCDRLWVAASDIGFFQISNTSVPREAIVDVFAAAEAYFALPMSAKNASALVKERIAGYESRGQVRPSTRLPDEKESYQMSPGRMIDRPDLYPDESLLPGLKFREKLDRLYDASTVVTRQLLSCFAERLGLPGGGGYFEPALRPRDSDARTTLRLMHYYPLNGQEEGISKQQKLRAGPHTDFTLLSLIYQRPGEDGLQACAGRNAAAGKVKWTPVPALGGDVISINVGDQLMRWSDDELKSTVHRVATPSPGEPAPERYSLGFFAHANEAAVVAGPKGKYPAITSGEYITSRMRANFAALTAIKGAADVAVAAVVPEMAAALAADVAATAAPEEMHRSGVSSMSEEL